MRAYPYLCMVLGFAMLPRSDARAQVRVWEGKLTLPTYEEGLADPNPPFGQFAACFDGGVWQQRLRLARADAERRTQTSSFAGWWHCTTGTLQAALGNRKEADREFQKAFLLPDRMMSYHCTRLARAENWR